MMWLTVVLAAAFLVPGQGRGGAAPRPGNLRPGSVENVVVGSPDHNVTVYLPPSYATDSARRFPVFYFLPDSGARSDASISAIKEVADRMAALQGFSEQIIVTPDAQATGDWARFIAEDLVAYVDMHYRTLAVRISRGLAGISMGGNSALQIGMKRPDVFSSLYIMSASINSTPDALVQQNETNLKKLYSLSIDIGSGDPSLAANRQLHDAMMRLHIPHRYEEYDGDHTAKFSERIERNLLPFFSKNLAAPANPTSPA